MNPTSLPFTTKAQRTKRQHKGERRGDCGKDTGPSVFFKGRKARETLVPTLRVGMPSGPLRGLIPPAEEDDAERRRRHSHAERGNVIPVSLPGRLSSPETGTRGNSIPLSRRRSYLISFLSVFICVICGSILAFSLCCLCVLCVFVVKSLSVLPGQREQRERDVGALHPQVLLQFALRDGG
jgi:hypothetical protein